MNDTTHAAARQAFLERLGQVDEHRIAPFLPFHNRWPAGSSAWAVVRNGDTTYVMSDGLSDPFEDHPVGFGIELIMATRDPVPSPITSSWLFQAVQEMSQQAVRHGALGELLDELGCISGSIAGISDAAPEFVTHDGGVGLLMGIRSPHIPATFSTPQGDVKVVVCRLLRPNELEDVLEGADEARAHLRTLFEKEPQPELTSMSRPSYSERPEPAAEEEVTPPSMPEPEGEPSSTLVIMGVSSKATEEEIKALFAQAGTVASVMKNPMMTTVEMGSVEAGRAAARRFNGHPLHKQPIKILYARRR